MLLSSGPYCSSSCLTPFRDHQRLRRLCTPPGSSIHSFQTKAPDEGASTGAFQTPPSNCQPQSTELEKPPEFGSVLSTWESEALRFTNGIEGIGASLGRSCSVGSTHVFRTGAPYCFSRREGLIGIGAALGRSCSVGSTHVIRTGAPYCFRRIEGLIGGADVPAALGTSNIQHNKLPESPLAPAQAPVPTLHLVAVQLPLAWAVRCPVPGRCSHPSNEAPAVGILDGLLSQFGNSFSGRGR